ncbi:MAG: hypothetical protein WCW25_03485 [Patescibacteria group bacterium]
MNRRYFAIALIVIGAVLIAGLIYFFFFYEYKAPAEAPAVNEPTGGLPQTGNTNVPAAPVGQTGIFSPATKPKKEEMGEAELKRMAGSFAERFGSYSNQSDYSNIEDLMIFMTNPMKEWAKDYVAKTAGRSGDRSIYYGITTKAVAEEVKNYDEIGGAAEILVKSQRREATGARANSRTFYQDIAIRFKKESNAWKVDAAIWQTD